eukprot:2560043-Alexandrium_andersonii.AAC.1
MLRRPRGSAKAGVGIVDRVTVRPPTSKTPAGTALLLLSALVCEVGVATALPTKLSLRENQSVEA